MTKDMLMASDHFPSTKT